jgi:imidazoleglycerol-phosphate dehydratase
VAVDISGRGYAVVEADFDEKKVQELPPDLVRHFLESFAIEARIALHVKTLSGTNDHHKAEAIFKALAKALRDAVTLDERLGGKAPSTKGTISG